MSGDNFHDAQDGVSKPDKQPGQEEQASDFNPTNIAECQTRLIIKAVKDLVMNPEARLGSPG